MRLFSGLYVSTKGFTFAAVWAVVTDWKSSSSTSRVVRSSLTVGAVAFVVSVLLLLRVKRLLDGDGFELVFFRFVDFFVGEL